MRRWTVRSLNILLVLAAVVAIDRYVNRDEIRAAAMEEYRRELQRVVIPRLELKDASIGEALNHLKAEARKAGMKEEFRFNTLSGDEGRKRIYFRPRIQTAMIPGLESAEYAPDPNPARLITVSLFNIPVGEALQKVTDLSDHAWVVGDRCVELIPGVAIGTYDRIVKRAYRMRYHFPGFVSSSPLLPNGHLDVREPLKMVGVAFPDGTSADYNPQTRTLVLVNTEENADLVAGVVPSPQGCFPLTRTESAKQWLSSQFQSDSTAQPSAQVNE